MLRGMVTAILLAGVLACPAMAQIRYEGGDGTTIDTAIVILGAGGETDGVDAEYVWLDRQFPGYALTGQALLDHEGKAFDAMSVRHKGKDIKVFFDISDFFGKY